MTNKSFTIWRAILIAGMVIGLAGIVGEMVWSADKGKLNGVAVIAMATSAKITIVEAVETVLGNVAGQIIKAELEERGDKTVWNVEILTAKEAIMTVYVDAVSGSVILTEEKVAGRKVIQDKPSSRGSFHDSGAESLAGRVTEFQVKCERGLNGTTKRIANGQYPRCVRYVVPLNLVSHAKIASHYLDDGGSHV